MSKIVYNFASRSRKAKLISCIENIIEMSTEEDFLIILTLDVNDSAVANQETWDQLKSYGEKVIPIFGFSTGKINAVNRSCHLIPPCYLVINFSDDFEVLQKGFDTEILNDAREFCPTGSDFFLHYDDGSPAGKLLPTMNVCGYDYFKRFNYIYHYDFVSVWCDNENLDVAKILGKYKYLGKSLWLHKHPCWGLSEKDEQYLKTEDADVYLQDQKTYIQRKQNNFFL